MARARWLKVWLFIAVLAATKSQNIPCPFPGGTDIEDSNQCARYSACEYTTGCYLKSNAELGYEVVSGPVASSRGFSMQLRRISRDIWMYEKEIENLTFEVIYHEDYHVQIKITDTDDERYEVPVPLNLPSIAGSNPMYTVDVTSTVGSPFSFSISRNSNGNRIFEMAGALIYETQFIQFTTKLMTEYLYGFGEATHTKFKRAFPEKCAIFARDHIITSSEVVNEYGHHPYYMPMEDEDGNSHSVFYFNSNAMEYETFMDGSDHMLTLRTIGGIVDLHFFLGPTPEDTNTQYINTIGLPVFPPYYMLGFQLSRWGYKNLTHVQNVVSEMQAAGIPQDIQTFDIDYMYEYRDFTYDTVLYAGLPEYIHELHNMSLRVTLILDPAVVTDWDNYPPAQRGKDLDVYVKWMAPHLVPNDQNPLDLDYMVGKVWPEHEAVFPDFLKPNTAIWWQDELTRLYYDLELEFDAIWVDMNEPANFDTDMTQPWSLCCPRNHLDSPFYPTCTTYTGTIYSGRISDHSLCMSGLQSDGVKNYTMYDVHSLYGWSHVKVTYESLKQMFPANRQMVLVRSTFPGAGQYGVHWLGDNSAQWSHMEMSLIGMMEFNMFGIPYVGADVCGFLGDTTEQLCGRWTALGAFYPFNRNHNADGYIDQHPSEWDSVTAIAIKYYALRYQYNPYLYDLFYRANLYGSTVVRPLLNNFPSDMTARDIDDQFMWANGFLIAPVLYENTYSRDVYFPEGEWYDLITGELIATGPIWHYDISVPTDVILVYARGGVIYPFQEPAMTTAESRLNPFGMTVALDASQSAAGEIYWDDGESVYSTSTTFLASMTFNSDTLIMTVGNDLTAAANLNIETLKFFGYPSNPSAISVNGGSLDSSAWTYDSLSVLTVTLSVPLNADLTVVLSP